MQESWAFQLTDLNKKDFKSAVESTLKKEEKDLGIFLSFYFKKEGAVAEKVVLIDEPIFNSSNSGSLTLEFDLVHFNACLAIHEQKRDQMKVDFLIDENENKLTLTGPYWPERGVDDI